MVMSINHACGVTQAICGRAHLDLDGLTTLGHCSVNTYEREVEGQVKLPGQVHEKVGLHLVLPDSSTSTLLFSASDHSRGSLGIPFSTRGLGLPLFV